MSSEFTCRAVVELLMDYVDGTLGTADQAAIEAHFSRCPRCVEFVRSYRETPRILRDATAAAMPEELKENLRRFLETRRQGR